ncbi:MULTISPECIES: hypothetical protein [unclassified Acinetobacter]|uniref:hypothetical protein n=1 Tax=unclassified Acinetobacter TaxID=196816 RepID=UPI0024480551|nr:MULTISPECIES: hypothetical protein [unclassified Acinetobacter]MDH0032537.1 hypothetical protein [Acinetobacter sp. GD04021]MDH0885228.1 hypothetical protein [Acinetobacter sp. GD03873]MDH1084444.1 hypothetical protein [Acinetobacter sp. GD03983]MDH2188332.1 hypothetical protein [Acinetobacter sp. GD03645]MDH2203843.1 hypothetical protein [Acinetobacter sp. GD03647]
MNINTLSEHRCADKCTDFKATGEQCNHCLVSNSEIPNSLGFADGSAVALSNPSFKLSELKQIIAEMTAANDRLILKYMSEKRQEIAAIHGSFNVALAGLILQLELPQGNTKKHIQLAETELYRQQQKAELLKTEKLATQVELDAHHQLLSKVGGIQHALNILYGNSDDFSFYSLEQRYYCHSVTIGNLISIEALEVAVCQYFIERFGSIQAIQYIVDQAPKEATHFNYAYEKLNPREESLSLWVGGKWVLQAIGIFTYKKTTAESVSISDLQIVLEHYKSVEFSESTISGEHSFSYSQITKSTEEQIKFFNEQKKIAEDGEDQHEAISFDHQADGAYLLWLRLTKGCRKQADNEHFQALVGAKA